MADQALAMESDADKPVRKCAWCGVDISHRHPLATHCSSDCREAKNGHNKYPRARQFGPFPPRACAVCGVVFECRDARQIYCKRGGRCSQIAYRKSDSGVAYFSSEKAKASINNAARRYALSEHGKAAQKERDARPENKNRRLNYARSERGRQARVECQRRRAAERALALLLMPVHKTPEAK